MKIFRVFDQRLVRISDISGKYDCLFVLPFLDRQFNTCRSQKMPGINKPYRNSFCRSNHFIIRTVYKIFDNAHGIFHRVRRHEFRFALSSAFTVSPLCLEHLDMCTVTKHDITEMAGCICGINRSLETFCINCRQISGVIHMRMGQKHEVQFSRCHGNFCILIIIRSLFHTTVNQKLTTCCFQIIT